MKKTLISLAAASLVASSAFAADKGIDINVGGQAVVWYQTVEDNSGDTDLFDQNDAVANIGIQLDLGADLGNNFTFGSQVSYIGSLGLENNLVDNTIQGGVDIADDTANQLMLTKVFVAKKIGNTTVKIGRQELPKSLSPLAYTEGWNVFKNVFDAAVAINTDIPNTTIVAAWVGNTSGHGLDRMESMNQSTSSDASNTSGQNGGAYMLTAQTTAIPMATVTASYYNLPHTADALWGTAEIADKGLPLGLKVGLQAGKIDPKAASAKDTKAAGAKVSISPMDKLSTYIAYTRVSGSANHGSVAARNLGTGDKTPLYTQLVLTEDSASLDAKAITGGISYNMGNMGSLTARYGQVKVGENGNIDEGKEKEFDLIYSVKAGGVKYFAAYVNQERDFKDIDDTEADVIRVWARLNF